MKFLNVVLIVLIGHFSYAQKCVIVDKDSEFPISNVQVTNEDQSKSVVSDRNGILDLSEFEEMELLTIHHVSYVELELLKKQIKRDYTTIFLQFKSERLKEVFLSAAMEDVERSRIAEEIAVFSNKDIQNSVPQTSADMLAKIPGVKVQKTQFGGGSPVLRGMEANRILLVVDGVRMNNAIFRGVGGSIVRHRNRGSTNDSRCCCRSCTQRYGCDICCITRITEHIYLARDTRTQNSCRRQSIDIRASGVVGNGICIVQQYT